jgi:hypothetical protein
MPTFVKYRRVPVAWDLQSEAAETKLDRLVAITRERDFLAIALFSLVGLLIAICLVRFLPLPLDAATYLAQVS